MWILGTMAKKSTDHFWKVNNDGELTVTWNNILGQSEYKSFYPIYRRITASQIKKMQINLGF